MIRYYQVLKDGKEIGCLVMKDRGQSYLVIEGRENDELIIRLGHEDREEAAE